MDEERVTVVEDRGGGGGGANTLAIVIGVIVLLLALYVVFGTNLLRGGAQKIDADVKVEAPK